jgi:hypothetical protein
MSEPEQSKERRTFPTTLEDFRHTWKEDAGFRQFILADVARSIYMQGDFGHSHYFATLATPGVLDAHDVLALHVEIREQGGRREPEWRKEFEAAFPQFRHLLPPVDRNDLLVSFSYRLFKAVVISPNSERVRELLAQIDATGLRLSEFPKIHSASLKNQTLLLDCEDDNEDEDGEESEVVGFLDKSDELVDWIYLAQKIGDHEIVQLLSDAGDVPDRP